MSPSPPIPVSVSLSAVSVRSLCHSRRVELTLCADFGSAYDGSSSQGNGQVRGRAGILREASADGEYRMPPRFPSMAPSLCRAARSSFLHPRPSPPKPLLRLESLACKPRPSLEVRPPLSSSLQVNNSSHLLHLRKRRARPPSSTPTPSLRCSLVASLLCSRACFRP